METFWTLTIVLLLLFSIKSEKNILDSLDNYSEFLNLGDKKLHKINGNKNKENDIFKSKIEVLGDIFKTNVDIFKAAQKLDMVFLVDASSSVGDYNFKSELKFIKKLLSDVTVDYNHTRVSVISFSSAGSIMKNIDEISEPLKEHNKCLLLNKQLINIEYKGGETYTLGALEKAKEIFDASKRNDSKKVLFLITDGYSNGGSPIPLSKQLKDQQVTIFTIGIRNGNYKELYDISSYPGEFYSYLLDSYEEFESLARRALHVDLKSGDYIPLGHSKPCDGLCEHGKCCDDKAVCTCGTTTGHYSCVCQPGYYGSGLKNNCLPCTAGTYSDGPNLCLPCPDIYHTTVPPAYGIESCTCKIGYQPDENGGCKIVKCPKISIPQHGYLVKKKECSNVLNSACGIRCEVGYTMVGSSIRLCQSNATWSGTDPSCEVKTCSRLSAPKHGTIKCSQVDLDIVYDQKEKNFPVDTVCNFECEKGKILIGSTQRTCLPLARWDGLKTTCKQIKCNRLHQVKFAKIEPASCTTGKQEYGKVCKIICKEGFKTVGPKEKKCSSSHWAHKLEETSCVDDTPPNLVCPDNITATTLPGKKFGHVSWLPPNVTDNSGFNVSVWTKPGIKNITEYKFLIGVTTVTYFAQDVFQNRIKCKFFVIVEDKERPVIENCENPPVFLTSESKEDNITWDEPHIFDNSQNVTVIKTHEFGLFKLGTTTVTYTAVDGSGNKNICKINITLEESHCISLPDPQNGRSFCVDHDNESRCVITCDEGYALPLQHNGDLQQTNDSSNTTFICSNDEAMWYNSEGLMFPECSVTAIPNEVIQEGEISVDTEDDICSDSNNLEELENDIKLTLTHDVCIENCSLTLQTECEKERTEEKSNKIVTKRETFEEVPHRNKNKKMGKRVNVKFQVRGRYVFDNVTNSHNLQLGHNRSSTVKYSRPKFICPHGFVPRKNRCVLCPRGTFHNVTRNRCQSCDFGFYNDELGQTRCTSCPVHYSTRKLHSKKIEDCKEQCPPGTHARKKKMKYSRNRPDLIIERATLKPRCRSCPVGYYQPEYGHLRCVPCPQGYTTMSVRATNISQCTPTSLISCISAQNSCRNGVCLPANDYEYTCECFLGYVGTFCEKKLSDCDSQPCMNGGVCTTQTEGFLCSCPQGFSGKYCENTEEKCALDCSGNGVCMQRDDTEDICLCYPGFGGDNCEISIRYCENVYCENNGTCVEELNTFKCLCPMGYLGRRCNILPCDYRPCKSSEICKNLEVENATRNSYSCVCPDGYTGENCLEKIDFCINNPCLNQGTCVSNETTYECKCPGLYYGPNCQFKWSTKYLLNFPTYDVNDYIKLPTFYENLTSITACLWMQTLDNFNYGTLLSYATRKYDNAFTLTDYTGLVLYVNNEHIVTDILLNDGYWHHVCASWNSLRGEYRIMVDGELVKNGSGLAAYTDIKGRGNMIIGQEQDIIGGKFSQSESFTGNMAHIDIWSKFLTAEETKQHLDDCKESVFGNLYSWPEMQIHVQGNIKKQISSFCQKCEVPKTLYNGFINVVDNLAFYSCYPGYELSEQKYFKGRKCTKTAKWEGFYEPYCKRVYCGYPGFVRNAYSIGNKYYYQDKVSYECYEGYNITGSNTIVCSENGTWFPEKPRCIGTQCLAFNKPDNSDVTIFSDEVYEEFIENQTSVDVGTQIEISCHLDTILVGENVVTCLESGSWDYPPPMCNLKESPTSEKPESSSRLDCSVKTVPPPPENGYIVLDSLYAAGNGTTDFVTYKCRPGYKSQGSNVSTCIVDGYWTDPNITCEAITCPSPPVFKSMVVQDDQINNGIYQVGNMLTYSCIEGYKLFGTNNFVRCLNIGRWSRIQGRCVKKSCRKPNVSEDTTIDGNSYLYEDVVTLHCPDGNKYELICDKDGVWTGERGHSC